MTMLQPIINGMWVGKTLSRMELLTIKSFTDHGHPFHLWAYNLEKEPEIHGCTVCDASDIIPLADVFRYNSGPSVGSYAGFSDVWRFKFLQDVGGWYVDMDVCCVKPFDYQQEHVLRLNRFNGDPTANIIRLPAGTAFAKEYCELAGSMVTCFNTDFYLPLSILGYLVSKHRMQQYFVSFNDFVNLHPGIKLATADEKVKALDEAWRHLGRSPAELRTTPLELLLTGAKAIHWGNERVHQEALSKDTPWKGTIYEMMLEKHGV